MIGIDLWENSNQKKVGVSKKSLWTVLKKQLKKTDNIQKIAKSVKAVIVVHK